MQAFGRLRSKSFTKTNSFKEASGNTAVEKAGNILKGRLQRIQRKSRTVHNLAALSLQKGLFCQAHLYTVACVRYSLISVKMYTPGGRQRTASNGVPNIASQNDLEEIKQDFQQEREM